MNWPISWNDVKNHIDDMQDGIPPELLPKGGFGYSEPSKTLTWDGDFDDTEMIFGELYACKITEKYVDLNSVESLVVKNKMNGDAKTLTASECIVHTEMGIQVLVSVEDETLYVISSPADVDGMVNKGLYFVWSPEFHVEQITFAGTIHPIDPKYLPTSFGNVLQVFIVETEGEHLTANVSFEEAMRAIANGMYLDAKIVCVNADGTSEFGYSATRYCYGPDTYDVPVIEFYGDDATIYLTPDGVSKSTPPGGK